MHLDRVLEQDEWDRKNGTLYYFWSFSTIITFILCINFTAALLIVHVQFTYFNMISNKFKNLIKVDMPRNSVFLTY